MLSKKFNILIIFCFIVLGHQNLISQNLNYPLGYDLNIEVNKLININDLDIHTSFKPAIISDKVSKCKIDSSVYQIGYNKNLIDKMPVKWFLKKLLEEDFVKIENANLDLYINPLINYNKGQIENDTIDYMQNTRGVEIHGNLGKKLSFYSDFYENQAFFIPYITEKIENQDVVPGQGAWKYFKKIGYDFAMASGYISFTPINILNIQFGSGKHFIGEGYRSLLLSDNSFNYPFLKFSLQFKKFQYYSIFTEFNDFYGKFYSYHYTKHGTFNYLSYKPISKIEIGVFESIVWNTSDDSTYVKHIPVSYFNPIILTRLFQYGLNNNNNMILGLNLKISPTKYTQVYAQGVLDNIEFKDVFKKNGFFENKFGYQVGAKIFDVFHGKLNKQSLYLQAEYNLVRPYTFSHSSVRQSYTHYNQELTHPLGAGFKETVLIGNYNFYNFYVQFKYCYALTSKDTLGTTNFGSDVFKSNDLIPELEKYNNFTGEKNTTIINSKSITFGYIFNHRTYLQLFGNILIRDYSTEVENKSLFYISFGIKTSLNNYYYDF